MIKLQQTAISDLDFIIAAERHPDNAQYVYQWSYEDHLAALTNPNIAHFVVVDVETNENIGYLILDNVQDPSHSINLRRIVITQKGLGIGRKTLLLAQREAFEKLNANRLWLDVFTDNQKAYQLYKKVGFKEEGLLRESYLRKNKYASQYIMSILRSEYLQQD